MPRRTVLFFVGQTVMKSLTTTGSQPLVIGAEVMALEHLLAQYIYLIEAARQLPTSNHLHSMSYSDVPPLIVINAGPVPH